MDVSDPTENVTPVPAFLVSNSNTSHRLSNNSGINIRVIPINLHETDGLVLHREMEDKPGLVPALVSLPADHQKPADGFDSAL